MMGGYMLKRERKRILIFIVRMMMSVKFNIVPIMMMMRDHIMNNYHQEGSN